MGVFSPGDGTTVLDIVLQVICLVLAAFIGIFWYWRRHHDIVKQIPLKHFAGLTAICFSICFYGTLIVAIFGDMIFKLGFNKAFGLGAGLSLIVAVIVWLWSTSPLKVSQTEIN